MIISWFRVLLQLLSLHNNPIILVSKYFTLIETLVVESACITFREVFGDISEVSDWSEGEAVVVPKARTVGGIWRVVNLSENLYCLVNKVYCLFRSN